MSPCNPSAQSSWRHKLWYQGHDPNLWSSLSFLYLLGLLDPHPSPDAKTASIGILIKSFSNTSKSISIFHNHTPLFKTKRIRQESSVNNLQCENVKCFTKKRVVIYHNTDPQKRNRPIHFIHTIRFPQCSRTTSTFVPHTVSQVPTRASAFLDIYIYLC